MMRSEDATEDDVQEAIEQLEADDTDEDDDA